MEFLKKLGEALGLDPELLKDEATAEALILQQIQTLLGKPAETPPAEEVPDDEEEELSQAPAAAAGQATAAGKLVKESTTREFAAAHPMVIQTLTENRSLKIDKLVEAGTVTPAQAEALKKQYASEAAVKLALSSEKADDGFDAILKVFDMGTGGVKAGEKSGAQVMSLSDTRKGGDKKNGLIENAKARAERAKK